MAHTTMADDSWNATVEALKSRLEELTKEIEEVKEKVQTLTKEREAGGVDKEKEAFGVMPKKMSQVKNPPQETYRPKETPGKPNIRYSYRGRGRGRGLGVPPAPHREMTSAQTAEWAKNVSIGDKDLAAQFRKEREVAEGKTREPDTFHVTQRIRGATTKGVRISSMGTDPQMSVSNAPADKSNETVQSVEAALDRLHKQAILSQADLDKARRKE
ncbi:hypothetical protein K505DRAFT_416265 [Melanomma pulvis-pyrius CBS 109.77]|uniref:Uncharacterized protein n=1 Tax=Melanomma pulvis-pyrius CBS 109.77 TaxID=1314802 RepID=A0A6A6XGS8_9PLEO|nr:hypothetical protein K505DRAFT_416265 [Melanomma pulvis-pyrius CBS 109.77]